MSSQLSIAEAPRQGLNARQAGTVSRLLSAGAEELRAVGPEALTIRGVAQRAGVSPATAYTYLSSKSHLFAELFWRYLVDDETRASRSADPAVRLKAVTRGLSRRLRGFPELADAVTPALLGSDPDVARMRLKIGAEFLRRFADALGPAYDTRILDVMGSAFFGALLQVGIGLMTYDDLEQRLGDAVEVIMRGSS